MLFVGSKLSFLTCIFNFSS